MRILRSLSAALALWFAGMACGQAQESVYVVSYIEVAPSARIVALDELRVLRDASRKEDGNSSFDVLQRLGRTWHFAIVEEWKDAKAQAAHSAAADNKSFHEKITPLLTAPIDQRIHNGFAVGRAADDKRAVYGLTHVDYIGAKKDEGLAALKQLRADSAKDTGLLRFDVLQQTSRPNHLTLVEAWRGRPAFEAHQVAAHTRKFREAILPMSGALYDQRLYKAVR